MTLPNPKLKIIFSLLLKILLFCPQLLFQISSKILYPLRSLYLLKTHVFPLYNVLVIIESCQAILYYSYSIILLQRVLSILLLWPQQTNQKLTRQQSIFYTQSSRRQQYNLSICNYINLMFLRSLMAYLKKGRLQIAKLYFIKNIMNMATYSSSKLKLQPKASHKSLVKISLIFFSLLWSFLLFRLFSSIQSILIGNYIISILLLPTYIAPWIKIYV